MKIDFPNLTDDDLEKRAIDDWMSSPQPEKNNYLRLSEDHPELINK